MAAPTPDFLHDMVLAPEYPCLGAKSVVRRGRAFVHSFGPLASGEATTALVDALTRHVTGIDPADEYASFVAVFDGPELDSETSFEALLWLQLQLLHDLDPVPWAPDVSSEPSSSEFAFSVAGVACFVVGMHPAATRAGRRTPQPTLVFNLHAQFEALRASGKYPRMRDMIRQRDVALQGSINPMAADHGSASEACQYSGRAVEPGWTAPFVPHPAGCPR